MFSSYSQRYLALLPVSQDANHSVFLCSLATVSSPIPSPQQRPIYEVPILLRRNAIAGGVALRILPLGDSITYVEGSSSGNGYRLALYNLLHAENEVNYIGRVKSGTMADNANETLLSPSQTPSLRSILSDRTSCS